MASCWGVSSFQHAHWSASVVDIVSSTSTLLSIWYSRVRTEVFGWKFRVDVEVVD
jgi:hypothetical protein